MQLAIDTCEAFLLLLNVRLNGHQTQFIGIRAPPEVLVGGRPVQQTPNAKILGIHLHTRGDATNQQAAEEEFEKAKKELDVLAGLPLELECRERALEGILSPRWTYWSRHSLPLGPVFTQWRCRRLAALRPALRRDCRSNVVYHSASFKAHRVWTLCGYAGHASVPNHGWNWDNKSVQGCQSDLPAASPSSSKNVEYNPIFSFTLQKFWFAIQSSIASKILACQPSTAFVQWLPALIGSVNCSDEANTSPYLLAPPLDPGRRVQNDSFRPSMMRPMPPYFNPSETNQKSWRSYIYIYISICAVKLLTGPSLVFSKLLTGPSQSY